MAFLQGFSRIQQIKGTFYLAMHRFVAADLGAIKARAQAIDLVINFAPAFLESFGQRRIDSAELLL